MRVGLCSPEPDVSLAAVDRAFLVAFILKSSIEDAVVDCFPGWMCFANIDGSGIDEPVVVGLTVPEALCTASASILSFFILNSIAAFAFLMAFCCA
jgi:hypothetical protein